MNALATLERLVPAGEVFDLLVSEHDRRGTYATIELCKRAALETLLARLKDGHLVGWATSCNIICDHPIEVPKGEPFGTWDFYSKNEIGPIPAEFWIHFDRAGIAGAAFDAVACDFRYDYTDDSYCWRCGAAYGVAFDRGGLPPAAVPSNYWSLPPQQENMPYDVDAVDGKPSRKGRKPANWWPDFAEELAFHIHEKGFPEGRGSEGQGELIDAIFEAMAGQGKSEPSRSQVQPVINAVLRRLRAAGNS
jgi:hypothetical protein